VYFCTEAGKETVFDYDLWEGEFVWKKNLGGISASPILVPLAATQETAAKPQEQLLCFGTLDGMFFALKPVTGEIVWKRKCGASIEGAACVLDSLVYCADTQGTVYALSAATGAVRWKQATGGAIYAGLSARGRTVYAGSRDHKLYAFDAVTGAVRWSYDCGERIMAAPSLSDSLVVVPALNGTVTALSPEGRLRWKFTARSAVNAPCTIAGDIVFAASLDTYCYALSAADGSVVWKHSIDARIKTVPLVWNQALFLIGDDKTLYKFVTKP
jgi:outer membrane protein assembly factor BamB